MLGMLARTGSLLVVGLSLMASTCSSGTTNTPQGTAQELYGAIADWDTAQITELACPETKNQISSGLLFGSALLGLGANLGLGVPQGKLRDMQYTVLTETPAMATVTVNGRILFGAPYGSFDIGRQTLELRKENGRWCVANDRKS